MRFPVRPHQFFALFPPYKVVEPVTEPAKLPGGAHPVRGAALLWNLCSGDWGSGFRLARERPPGMALFLLLPPLSEIEGTTRLLQLVEHCRPHSVLPNQEEIDPEEILPVLRRFPIDFGGEVTEYLRWRGVETDLDTRRLIRKTLDLSGELRSVSALARSLYISRRALGRRFLTRGLPVPSHWLHFARALRASLALQDPGQKLQNVATGLGYPDGFSLSNQMQRLMGLRPSIMRDCFGWEWIVEAWLFQEARMNNLSPMLRRFLFPDMDRVPGRRSIHLEGEERILKPPKMSVAERKTAEEG